MVRDVTCEMYIMKFSTSFVEVNCPYPNNRVKCLLL